MTVNGTYNFGPDGLPFATVPEIAQQNRSGRLDGIILVLSHNLRFFERKNNRNNRDRLSVTSPGIFLERFPGRFRWLWRYRRWTHFETSGNQRVRCETQYSSRDPGKVGSVDRWLTCRRQRQTTWRRRARSWRASLLSDSVTCGDCLAENPWALASQPLHPIFG